MIINEKLRKDMINLSKSIDLIINSNSITELQIEKFLQRFEKARYNILSEIKLYNRNVEFDYEKIKNIDNEYEASLKGDMLKIYIPEVLPSFKNIKTHSHKRILLNIAELTKEFAGYFENSVFIYIKIYDNIQGWDVDNRYIKPISDALIMAGVIKDDNISKMSYCVQGEYSEKRHTEVYVLESKSITDLLKSKTR